MLCWSALVRMSQVRGVKVVPRSCRCWLSEGRAGQGRAELPSSGSRSLQRAAVVVDPPSRPRPLSRPVFGKARRRSTSSSSTDRAASIAEVPPRLLARSTSGLAALWHAVAPCC
jgi:hypothetical protein